MSGDGLWQACLKDERESHDKSDDDNTAVILSWEAVEANDLSGYHVYRSDGKGLPFRRLTAAPVPDPLFVDASVLVGQTYGYYVTAVDRAGNESPGSQTLEVSVPAKGGTPPGFEAPVVAALAIAAVSAFVVLAVWLRRRRST